MLLYHGSEWIVEHPEYGKGIPYNDYGSGFYCTEHAELAKEWACKDRSGGWMNTYQMDETGLSLLDLDQYSILHWLALLVNHRRFRLTSELMVEGKNWLDRHYLHDVERYDVIKGYRADDSYFRFAKAFLQNSLSLESLGEAMHLGELGEQIVLKSPNAFQNIEFKEAVPVDGTLYFERRILRDQAAREQYDAILRETGSGGTYLVDLLREEVK